MPLMVLLLKQNEDETKRPHSLLSKDCKKVCSLLFFKAQILDADV